MARADMYNDYSGETFAYASPTSYTLNDSTYIALDADDFKSYDSVILILGKQNENNSRQIRFDISDWIEQFGEGTVQLNVKKPDAFDSYTVPLSREGNEAIWIVSSYDVDIPGKGLAELTYTFNNTEVIKSVTFGTVIFASISADSGTDEDNIYSARIGTNDLTYLTKDVDDFYSYDSNILILGKQGENHSRKITFNLTQWREEFGEGVLSLLVRRPSELSSYPVVLDMQDDLAIWNISNIDTAIFGKGLAELCYTYGNNYDKIDNCLVVFLTLQTGCIIGYYKNATIYRKRQENYKYNFKIKGISSIEKRDVANIFFNLKTKNDNAILIKTRFYVEVKKGVRCGQSNIKYVNDKNRNYVIKNVLEKLINKQ